MEDLQGYVGNFNLLQVAVSCTTDMEPEVVKKIITGTAYCYELSDDVIAQWHEKVDILAAKNDRTGYLPFFDRIMEGKFQIWGGSWFERDPRWMELLIDAMKASDGLSKNPEWIKDLDGVFDRCAQRE